MERTYYTAIPKDDLEMEPHTWEKGQKYQMVAHKQRVTLASEEGQVHFTPDKMGQLENVFEVSQGWER